MSVPSDVHVESLPDHSEAGHGTFRSYMTGFVLAVVLTAIPFWLVMGHVVPSSRAMALIIMGLAGIQVVVHMVYFLHMNTHSEGGWSMLALIFTVVVVVITLAGSVWVMDHLNANMMPMAPGGAHMSPEGMRNMP